MNDKFFTDEDRVNINYSDTVMLGQKWSRKLFDGDEEQFAKGLLDYIFFIQGSKHPKEEYNLEESSDMPIEFMGSSPAALRFLQSQVLLKQPKTLVEIGTFVGMSSIYMADCLPKDGRIFSFEFYESFAGIARRNIKANNLDDRIEVICGDAKETIPATLDRIGTVDMAFVDGDKGAYDDYFRMLDPHVPSGGLLIFDDILFLGDVLNEAATTEKGAGVKRMAKLSSQADNYHRTMLPLANGVLMMIKK